MVLGRADLEVAGVARHGAPVLRREVVPQDGGLSGPQISNACWRIYLTDSFTSISKKYFTSKYQ